VGIWCNVASKTDTKKIDVPKRLDHVFKIWQSFHAWAIIITIFTFTFYYFLFFAGAIWAFNEHENLCFDDELVIHMSFKNNEKSNYNLDYEFLTILYLSRVLCSMDEWASKNMTIYLILIYITSNTNIWVLGKPIKMMQVTKLSSFETLSMIMPMPMRVILSHTQSWGFVLLFVTSYCVILAMKFHLHYIYIMTKHTSLTW
jgi:hypothetical protein